jgi:hypothetical protein
LPPGSFYNFFQPSFISPHITFSNKFSKVVKEVSLLILF